jgi:hypothetical protein
VIVTALNHPREFLLDEPKVPQRETEPAGQPQRPQEQRLHFVARRVERYVLQLLLERHRGLGGSDGANAPII